MGIPSVNLTRAYENNLGYYNFGIMSHNQHFSEVVDVCTDGYSCTNKGQFYFGFQYQLPSFGSLNSIIDDYELKFSIVSYDYDSYKSSSSGSSNSNMKVLGNCQVFLSSDNSTVHSTVYAKGYGSGYFLFAAALIGTVAALSTLKKNNNQKEKMIFNCNDDEGTGIDAFQQMPSEFDNKHRKHSIPEKIFELKHYVSSSATMFWEETHSWPRASSTLDTPFAEADDDESSDSSPFNGLEDGILSGSIVSVSDVVNDASSLSHVQISSEEERGKNDSNNRVDTSFSCAVEGKEVNDKDENKFFIDDMKIVPSVDKDDLKKTVLTESESCSEDEIEEKGKDTENDEEKGTATIKKKEAPIIKKQSSKKPPARRSKKKTSQKCSGSNRFSIRKIFGSGNSRA